MTVAVRWNRLGVRWDAETILECPDNRETRDLSGGDTGVGSPLLAIENSFLGGTGRLDFATRWWSNAHLPIPSTNIYSIEPLKGMERQ